MLVRDLRFVVLLAVMAVRPFDSCSCLLAVTQALKHDTTFFIEYFATDLLMHNGALLAALPGIVCRPGAVESCCGLTSAVCCRMPPDAAPILHRLRLTMPCLTAASARPRPPLPLNPAAQQVS